MLPVGTITPITIFSANCKLNNKDKKITVFELLFITKKNLKESITKPNLQLWLVELSHMPLEKCNLYDCTCCHFPDGDEVIEGFWPWRVFISYFAGFFIFVSADFLIPTLDSLFCPVVLFISILCQHIYFGRSIIAAWALNFRHKRTALILLHIH